MAVERVRFLDSGTLVIDRSHIMWNIDTGNPVRFPVYSVLIEHTDGLFLFDSGYRPGDGGGVPALRAARADRGADDPGPARALRLRARRRDRGDQLPPSLRPRRRPAPPARRGDLGRQGGAPPRLVPEPFERLGYADKVFHRPDSVYRWLEGEEFDFADGIRLLRTPGHTVGHYSLLLEREGQAPMLFPADVTYTRETWEKELISGFHNDPTANYVSLRKVKHLARRLDAERLLHPRHGGVGSPTSTRPTITRPGGPKSRRQQR